MSAERWAELTKLYTHFTQVFGDDHFRAAVLAKTLRAQLANYLGAPSDGVLMFDYDETKDDAYTQESDPFKAVSMSPDFRWYVAYGITLESAPNAFPKTNFQFPVWFTIAKPEVEVDTSFGVVTIDGTHVDFSPACENIYRGLSEALIARANRSSSGHNKRIGFVEW